MSASPLRLLLADDDMDDCSFFEEVLQEIPIETNLTIVRDGVQLLDHLTKNIPNLPDALYLDLNMPLKNGFECLAEIMQHEELKDLPVIIFSTSFDKESANRLYGLGARYYIRKPPEFQKLRSIISRSLELVSGEKTSQTPEENFVIYSR